jgi:hypothetical protein
MELISIARYGMMAAESQLSASAQRVAISNGANGVDYGREAVSEVEAKYQFAANAKVVTIADDMWRALLDVQTS